MRARATVGTRVRVVEGSGLTSNMVGTVIMPVLDHRGIPITTRGGDYKQFERKGRMSQRMVQTDDGETFVMFTCRLVEV